MADRATINKVSLIAPESVAGTAPGTVTKQLQATSIEPAVAADIKMFGPVGSEFDTISQLTKEWSTSKVTSEIASFTDLVYLLSMWCDVGAITTPGGGTTSRQWLFSPTDAIKTYTIDNGDAANTANAQRVTYALMNDFNMEFSRNGISAGGTLFSRRIADPVTLSASPSLIAQVPLDPNNMDFYISTVSQADLDSQTPISRGFRAMFKVSNRWSPIWPVGSAFTSFGAHIKRKPTVEFGLQMGADSAGYALLPIMRTNAPVWFRVKVTGPLIEGAINYTLQLDCAARIKTAPDTADLDGLDTLTWTTGIVKDATWNKPFLFKLINMLAAL